MSTKPSNHPPPDALASKIAHALVSLVASLPSTSEPRLDHPEPRLDALIRPAATRAAVAAGTLALPVGPLGWLTIVPELLTVWRIQAQLVADVAGVYGKTATLSQEQMLYCLFRHSAAQVARDLVVRVGQRVLIERASQEALHATAKKIGMHMTRRWLGTGVARVLPVVGAAGVGAYAFYDTKQVARTTIALFEDELARETRAQA